MESKNNNQMLLLAVTAVALYFFMKYRECSKQENFSSHNINYEKRWHDRWRDNMIECGLYLGEKNCKKTKKRFDSDWTACKANQTNICLQKNDELCKTESDSYKVNKKWHKNVPKSDWWLKQMKIHCKKLKHYKCHPDYTDGDCIRYLIKGF